MANVISRIVRLVLDRKAAAQTEADAKRSLTGIDKALLALKRAALAAGAAIVAALSVRALKEFGAAAVREASRAQKVWNDLKGTIEATGVAFATVETRLRNMAAAFQDATTVGDEEFAEGLTRMIALTGDVEASVTNMGLAADVAAQFFNGDLAPAVELVAKVSTGYTQQLRRMGIAVDSAQEGLDVLAQRSAGAAARQMETLAGQTQVANNKFGDFLETIGFAILKGAEHSGVMEKVIGLIERMTDWVIRNEDALVSWVTKGLLYSMKTLRILGITIDAVANGFIGLGQVILGPLAVALGTAVRGMVLLSEGMIKVVEIGAKFADFLGLDGIAGGLTRFTESINAQNEALANWSRGVAEAGARWTRSGFQRFGNTMLDWSPIQVGERPGFRPDRPVVANGTGTDEKAEKEKKELDAVTEALKHYEEAMRVAHGMQQLLGSEFDFTSAKVSALEGLMQSLLAAGVDPATVGLRTIAQTLKDLQVVVDPVSDAIMALDEEFQNIDTMAMVFGDSFDHAAAKVSALESAIQSLILEGLDASDPVMQAYIAQWEALLKVQQEAEEQAANYALAVDNLSSVIVGALGGELAEVAKAKAKENLLLAAEQTAHGIVSLLNPLTAGKAGGHFASAAKFGAIAAGWAALGSMVGGGGGGSLGRARGASGGASESAEPPGPDISIYLTGDMNALDPRVQKWVMGATKEGEERYGNNATVRVVPVRR